MDKQIASVIFIIINKAMYTTLDGREHIPEKTPSSQSKPSSKVKQASDCLAIWYEYFIIRINIGHCP